MTTSNGFRLLELDPSFTDSLLEFEKENYSKRDKKGPIAFRELMQETFLSLENFPHVAGLHLESFPPKVGPQYTDAGWFFYKLAFTTPGVDSSGSRQGRLMLLVHRERKAIVPVYVYTHKQFPGRVPPRSLSDILHAIVERQKKAQDMEISAGPSGAAGIAKPESE